MSARQEKVREAVERIPLLAGDMYQRGQDMRDGTMLANEIDALLAAALAEVEEWETRLASVAQAWFDFDQEALDTLLGPYREEA